MSDLTAIVQSVCISFAIMLACMTRTGEAMLDRFLDIFSFVGSALMGLSILYGLFMLFIYLPGKWLWKQIYQAFFEPEDVKEERLRFERILRETNFSSGGGGVIDIPGGRPGDGGGGC